MTHAYVDTCYVIEAALQIIEERTFPVNRAGTIEYKRETMKLDAASLSLHNLRVEKALLHTQKTLTVKEKFVYLATL